MKAHAIPTSFLPRPRSLYLADGQLRDWIREFTTLDLQIGAHTETISLFITPLAAENPVILGIPWLQQHNPHIDWITLDVSFLNCGPTCLPPGAPPLAPRAPDRGGTTAATSTTTTAAPPIAHKAPSVEDGPEEDDLYDVNLYTAAWQRARRAKRQREKRRAPRPLLPPPQKTAPARKAGPMRIMTKPRPPARPRPLLPEPDEDPGPINSNDIKLLNATNFLFLSRQKGVKVMRTTMAELERTTQREKEDKTPSVILPELSEAAFKDLLQGNQPAEHWKTIIPEACHDFIDYISNNPIPVPDFASPPTASPAPTAAVPRRIRGSSARRRELAIFHRRINEEDAAQFFAKLDKAPLTDEEIRKRMPSEYHDLLHVARPQEAEELPPHRSYDHKIELIPGAPLPYSRNRPMSPTELTVIKR